MLNMPYLFNSQSYKLYTLSLLYATNYHSKSTTSSSQSSIKAPFSSSLLVFYITAFYIAFLANLKNTSTGSLTTFFISSSQKETSSSALNRPFFVMLLRIEEKRGCKGLKSWPAGGKYILKILWLFWVDCTASCTLSQLWWVCLWKRRWVDPWSHRWFLFMLVTTTTLCL